MRRREVAALIVGAITAPRVAIAEQKPLPVIGYLHSGSPGPLAQEVSAFHQGLAETGYIPGKNVAIEYRWAEGEKDRLPALAADLVRRNVSVIAAIGGDATALAVKAATSTIPVVFQIGSDPIKSGLVASLNRPGGNLTGLSLFVGVLDAKRLELLHEVAPDAEQIAVLVSTLVAEAEDRLKELEGAAGPMGLRLLPLRVSDEGEFEPAFATATARNSGALLVFGSAFFDSKRDRIVGLAARYGIPAAYAWREFVVDGGLMSYGTSLTGASRQGAIYVGRILNGEKPADLPVQQPAKFEVVVNLKTAKALRLTIPQSILARADEVIE